MLADALSTLQDWEALRAGLPDMAASAAVKELLLACYTLASGS